MALTTVLAYSALLALRFWLHPVFAWLFGDSLLRLDTLALLALRTGLHPVLAWPLVVLPLRPDRIVRLGLDLSLGLGLCIGLFRGLFLGDKLTEFFEVGFPYRRHPRCRSRAPRSVHPQEIFAHSKQGDF